MSRRHFITDVKYEKRTPLCMKFDSGKVAKIASTKMNRLSYIALLQVKDNYSWLNGDFEECLCFFFVGWLKQVLK